MMLASQHGRSGGCTDGRRGCGCGTVWTRGYRRRSSRGGSDQRADDPPVDRAGHLDRDLAVGPARYSARPPVLHKLDPYNRTTRSLTRGWRCSPAVRGGCSTRCAWRGTRAATAGCGTTCAWCRRASRPNPGRYETPPGRQGQVDYGSSRCRGDGTTRCWCCSAIRAQHTVAAFLPRQTMAVL